MPDGPFFRMENTMNAFKNATPREIALATSVAACKSAAARQGIRFDDEMIEAVESLGYICTDDDGAPIYTDSGSLSVRKGSARYRFNQLAAAVDARGEIDGDFKSAVWGVHLVELDGSRVPFGQVLARAGVGSTRPFVIVGAE